MHYLYNHKYVMNMFRIIHQLHLSQEKVERITKELIEVTYQSMLFNLLDELLKNVSKIHFGKTEDFLVDNHYQRYIQKKLRDLIQKYPIIDEEVERKLIKKEFQIIISDTISFQVMENDGQEERSEYFRQEIKVVYLLDFIQEMGKRFDRWANELTVEERTHIIVPLLESFYMLYRIEISPYKIQYPNKQLERSHPSLIKTRTNFSNIINLYGSSQINTEQALNYFKVTSYFKPDEVYYYQKHQEVYEVFKVKECKGNIIEIDWIGKEFNQPPTYNDIHHLLEQKNTPIKKQVLRIHNVHYLSEHFKILGHYS